MTNPNTNRFSATCLSLLSAPGPSHSVPGGGGLDWNAYSEREIASRFAAGGGEQGAAAGAGRHRSVTWGNYTNPGRGGCAAAA